MSFCPERVHSPRNRPALEAEPSASGQPRPGSAISTAYASSNFSFGSDLVELPVHVPVALPVQGCLFSVEMDGWRLPKLLACMPCQNQHL
eukprot:1156910-Pelagomonas_calceolata.AAC.3